MFCGMAFLLPSRKPTPHTVFPVCSALVLLGLCTSCHKERAAEANSAPDAAVEESRPQMPVSEPTRPLSVDPRRPAEACLVAHFPFEGSVSDLTGNAELRGESKEKIARRRYVPGVRGKALKLLWSDRTDINARIEKLSPESGTLMLWFRNGCWPYSEWGLQILHPADQSKPGPWIEWNKHQHRWMASIRTREDKNKPWCIQPFRTPNPHDWEHITLTWDKKDGKMSLYVNGRLPGPFATTPYHAPDSFGESVLNITPGPGDGERFLFIDDLRIYDRALTAEEIAAFQLPYAFDFDAIPMKKRVFSIAPGESASFTAHVSPRPGAPAQATFLLETLDAEGKVLWSGEHPLTFPGGQAVALTWQVPGGESGGTTYAKATWIAPKTDGRPSRAVELMRLTKRPHPHPHAMDVRKSLVKTIDCTAAPDPATYLESEPTHVVDSPLGKYRIGSSKIHSWICYRFPVKAPRKPHVLAVTWPDDAKRIMAFDIADGSGSPPRGAGVMSGVNFPVSGKMQRREMIFWPATENCALFVCSWLKDKPLAIAKIEVYAVDDEHLPTLPLPPTPDPDHARNFGMWMEDASVFNQWSSGERGLEAWRASIGRLAEFMSYSGQNVFQYPLSWYEGTLFPCTAQDRFGWYSTSRRAMHPDGAFDIMLKIFEDHDITFYPIFYFRETNALWCQTSKMRERPEWLTVANWPCRFRGEEPGGDAMFQYRKDGSTRQSPYRPTRGPIFNPLHPAVATLMRQTLRDWLDLYGDYPAMGGLYLDLGVSWDGLPGVDCFQFDSLDAGYGDFTVGLFEKDTGVKVPGNPGDEERFMQRYTFLTSPEMREKWVGWRCRRIREDVVMPLVRMVLDRRPDTRVILGIAGRKGIGSPALGCKKTWDQVARECGLDMALYKNIPRVHIQRHGVNFQIPDKLYPADFLDASWPIPNGSQAGVLGASSPYWEIFDKAKNYQAAAEKWPEIKATITPVRVITDAGPGVLRDTSLALGKCDVSTIVVGGMGDSPLQGHHEEVSHFVRAFRTLPAISYKDIPGLDDPVRVRQATCEAATYAYLVNLEPYDIPIILKLSPDTAEAWNLGEEKQISVTGDELSLTVPAHQLVALRLKGGEIIAGRSSVPEKESARLLAAVGELRQRLEEVGVNPPENPGDAYLWREMEDFTTKSGKQGVWHHSRNFHGKLLDQGQQMSGKDDIIIGGDKDEHFTYQVSAPRSGTYTLWVRHTFPTHYGDRNEFRFTIEGKTICEWRAPMEEEAKDTRFWRRVTRLPLPEGISTLRLTHLISNWSTPLDTFLLTTDDSYVPTAILGNETLARQISEIERLIKQGHLARARALIAAFRKSAG